jgi:probable HAF family extracellular repeat protein
MNAILKYAAALVLITWSASTFGQTYTLTDLGTLGGGNSYASSVNIKGEVTGSSLTSDGDRHAYIYTNGLMRDLGVLAGPESVGYAMNDVSQIAGSSSYVAGNASWIHAVLFSDGSILDLRALSGSNSEAIGINNNGELTGYTAVLLDSVLHAFVYNDGQMVDLGTLGGTMSEGLSINDKGQIAGWSWIGSIDPASSQQIAHAFIYQDGSMKDLGSLGASQSFAFGINGSGEVVGNAAVAFANGSYLYHAFLYRGENMLDLGTLPGDLYSNASAINDQGDIAGSSVPTADSLGRAMLYTNAKKYDLNDLDVASPLAQYVQLYAATGISNNGYIVANGVDSRTGERHGYLLTPSESLSLACPMAAAEKGVSYSSAMSASGGVEPYMFSDIGNLPGGLTLNTSTGAVAGTPTGAGTFSFTAKVADSSRLTAEAASAPCTITVSVKIPVPNVVGLTQAAATAALTKAGLTVSTAAKVPSTTVPVGSVVSETPAAGSVVAAGVAVNLAVSSGPALILSPTSLAFGTQTVGTTSPGKTFTITNVSSTSVSLASITVTGVQADDFSLTKTCGSTLAPAASCTVSVVFTPVSAGGKAASVSVADNAAGSPQNVALSGTGGPGSSPIVSFSLGALEFSSRAAGTTSPAQTVELTNRGGATLSITSLKLAGLEPDDFALINGCGSSLAASASCTFSVAFRPVSAGNKQAAIVVTDNASGSPQNFLLTGTGIAAGSPPITAYSTTSLNFSGQTVGTISATQTVTLTNNGGSTLSITSVTLTGADPDDFVLTNGCGTTLGPSLSCTLSIAFRPVSSGPKAATVAVADNASPLPQEIVLKGKGVAAITAQVGGLP